MIKNEDIILLTIRISSISVIEQKDSRGIGNIFILGISILGERVRRMHLQWNFSLDSLSFIVSLFEKLKYLKNISNIIDI